MRLLFTFTLLLSLRLNAQVIILPAYQQGQYDSTTLFTYYGSLPLTGVGSVDFMGAVTPNLITGMSFKMVVDSINNGSSTAHAVVWDSLGIMVPLYKGDTLDIPANFQLMVADAAVGFHVIFEGTPSIAGESYFCELMLEFLLGSDWGLRIKESPNDTCFVEKGMGLDAHSQTKNVVIYPNPFHAHTTISFENPDEESHTLIIYDACGKVIRTVEHIKAKSVCIEKNEMSQGPYYFKLASNAKIVAKGILVAIN